MTRESLKKNFIKAQGWESATLTFLAGDCSLRTYDRLQKPNGDQAVLMDAYGEEERVQEFIEITRLLEKLGCSSPKVMGSDLLNRFLLLEDFSDRTFTRCLKEGMDAKGLYESAVDVLIHIHKAFSMETSLGVYSEDLMLDHNRLFLQCAYPAIHGKEAPQEAERAWMEAWRGVLKFLGPVPKTLILRDFHVDNLVWLENREGHKRCGLLDFQDALLGPIAYDLVSLLEDVRQEVPADLTELCLRRYLKAFPELSEEAFMAQYAILGAQRVVRIMGVFTRMLVRNKRPHYMRFMPRAWRLLEGGLTHPLLEPVRVWFDDHIPQEKRRSFT